MQRSDAYPRSRCLRMSMRKNCKLVTEMACWSLIVTYTYKCKLSLSELHSLLISQIDLDSLKFVMRITWPASSICICLWKSLPANIPIIKIVCGGEALLPSWSLFRSSHSLQMTVMSFLSRSFLMQVTTRNWPRHWGASAKLCYADS